VVGKRQPLRQAAFDVRDTLPHQRHLDLDRVYRCQPCREEFVAVAARLDATAMHGGQQIERGDAQSKYFALADQLVGQPARVNRDAEPGRIDAERDKPARRHHVVLRAVHRCHEHERTRLQQPADLRGIEFSFGRHQLCFLDQRDCAERSEYPPRCTGRIEPYTS
jgi:hypothetical protein